ncbi:MAG: LacI family DNA-binding transcriptional regulator [Phycisphaeraceae bacterium JB051]
MKSTKAVTAKDVAKAAGVSQSAVSLALRGSKEISAKRTKHIQAVARKLNYYPQAAGQLLRSKRKNQIGVVIASDNCQDMMASGFQAPILGALEAICYERKIAYQLELHHGDSNDISNLPHQIAAGMVDGALLIGDVGQDMYDALDQRPEFPWVSINEPTRYAVMMDFVGVTEQLLERVAGYGHRRVAYLGGPQRYLEHRLAYETFVRVGIKHGWDRVQKKDWVDFFSNESTRQKAQSVFDWTKKVMAKRVRPTAVICHGEPLARSVAQAAALLGLEPGRDVSITSWGSRNEAERTWPAMTSVVYEHEPMVCEALEMLQARINKPGLIKPQNRIVGASIHEGISLGPCPS